ncbi:MAG: hypothetical protein LBB83_09345 [Treponema sp.]|jgi:hypothetical protein|nr:hypothetical protein [Treponema sp.]
MPGAGLTLQDGVTLDGNRKDARLVLISGGELVMKNGAALRNSGGGVSVGGGRAGGWSKFI